MDFELLPLTDDDMPIFIRDMQEAFQKGAAQDFADIDEEILPESDIVESLSKKGAAAYKAVIDGEMLGGAIIVIDSETQHNHLDFLYVKYGTQSKGIGQKSGMKSKSFTLIRKSGKRVLHILKREIYTFI